MLDDSTTPVNGIAGPAHDWRDLIDEQFLPDAPRWHRGFDGEPHVTVEALERVETDLLAADCRAGGGA